MRGYDRVVAMSIAKLERQGASLSDALNVVMLDPSQSHFNRARIGKMISSTGDAHVVQSQLDLFFKQSEKDDLYFTALTLEKLNDRRAVPPLMQALLEDDNPHRRHAAARALGWIRKPGRAAALALARCLTDLNQPQPAREEAAESLAYVGTRETIDALVSVLHEPDVRIRFWAVFGLSSCRRDIRGVSALESMLDDQEVTPGNWWSVGKEALSVLVSMHPSIEKYKIMMATEVQRIFSDPDATVDDRRWADAHQWVINDRS